MGNKSRIIPIGGFCSVAKELERRGLRDASLPFDWVITDLRTVNQLLQDRFFGLFDPELLYRSEENRHVVKHRNYNFDFYHDFSAEGELEGQVESVRAKYERRISRLYKYFHTADEILFVHYAIGGLSTLSQDVTGFLEIVRRFECKVTLFVFLNQDSGVDTGSLFSDQVKVFIVVPDESDSVCRRFLRQPAVKKQFKGYVRTLYPLHRQYINRLRYFRKRINTKFRC